MSWWLHRYQLLWLYGYLLQYPTGGVWITVDHDDVIKWKHFPRYWPFVRGIRQSPVNSPHKGQRHGTLMLSLIGAWINGWVNNREAGDLRRHRAHNDVIVMCIDFTGTMAVSVNDWWHSFLAWPYFGGVLCEYNFWFMCCISNYITI